MNFKIAYGFWNVPKVIVFDIFLTIFYGLKSKIGLLYDTLSGMTLYDQDSNPIKKY